MKIVNNYNDIEQEIEQESAQDEDVSSNAHSIQPVQLVVQDILDQLILLEKCIDLKSFAKLEKLNKLDHLENLNYIKYIPQLRQEIEDLNLALNHLEKLKDLNKVDQLRDVLNHLDENLKLIWPKFKKLKNLDKLDKLDNIKELKKLDNLEHLKKLSNLKNLLKLEELNNLEQLNQLEMLKEIRGLDKLKELEHLDQLENLDLLQKIDKFEELTKKSNFSLLDKLDKLDLLKQEKSKIFGAIILKTSMDLIKNIIITLSIIFAFFFFAEKKEIIELTKSMLSLDAHTINISYQLLEKLSPLSKSKDLQMSFYNKSMYEVVNYWNNETFNPHSRLLALSFINDLNNNLIPDSMPHPLKEFEDIQLNEMKKLDSIVKVMPEKSDQDLEEKAYYSQIFLAVHNGQCESVINKLNLKYGVHFLALENKIKAQALYCLFKANESSLSKTLKKI